MNNHLAGRANSPIPFPGNYPNDIVSGRGAYVTNSDGQIYIDMWMGYGALIFGHANAKQAAAIHERLADGWFFSYPTLLEKQVADQIHSLIPGAELVRLGTSGSDAVSYAVRASRAYTGRRKVLTIKGGYHGVHENMTSNAGAISPRMPDKTIFNDTAKTVARLQTGQYACFVLEPILANNGCVPADPAYLEAVRRACTETGTVLVFDEVVTGFRCALSGAQGKYGVAADVSTFSKAVAGGLPLSVVCGKRDLMEQFAPTGEVFFAGTFNGSPVALANALCVIDMLKNEYDYQAIEEFRLSLSDGIRERARAHGVRLAVQGFGSMMSVAFDCDAFPHGVGVAQANEAKYYAFADYLAEHASVLLPPLFTETIFLSPVHIPVADELLTAFDAGFAWLGRNPG
jgi:glutamate-1-semialdehyde 2,1-aminomutase